MDSIDKYLKELYIKEDIEYMIEVDLKAALSKLSPSKKIQGTLKNFQPILNNKNPIISLKKVASKIKSIPQVNPKSIDKYLTPRFNEFKKLKNTAKLILNNSLPNISTEANELSSTFLALSSIYTKKSEKNLTLTKRMKNNSKDFVMRVRKFMDENDNEEKNKSRGIKSEDLPDLAVAWVIVAMTTAIAIGVGTGIIMIGSALASTVITFTPWAIMLIIVAGVLILQTKG